MVRFGVSVTAAVAVALASCAVAGAVGGTAPKQLSVADVTLGASAYTDRGAPGPRRLAATNRSSWWGGTYYTKAGEPVRVNVSDSYRYDPTYPQSVVDFLGALTHGSELSRVSLWIGPLSLIGTLCGNSASLGCYDPASGSLAVIGTDVDGYSVEQILMHEYGHHVANNRVNPPWQGMTWGPKRWASYENVCRRTAGGQAFPGDESTHYWQNPGEAFAESYMFLNAQRFGVLLPPWEYDPMFTPDYAALSKISEDVVTPWAGDKTFVWSGRFAARGTSRAATLQTPLDGTIAFRVTAAPRHSVLRVYADGRLLASVRAGAAGEICGQRAFTTRLTSGGTGRFRVVAETP